MNWMLIVGIVSAAALLVLAGAIVIVAGWLLGAMERSPGSSWEDNDHD